MGQILEIGAGVATLVAAVYGFLRFIDWRIDRKIQEESFLRRIASSLRPVVIFDENSSILLDQGGMDLIDKIEVQHLNSEGRQTEIIVHPKNHLPHAPLLQTLENELIVVEVSRGPGLQWSYHLNYQMYSDHFGGRRRFRLEVLL